MNDPNEMSEAEYLDSQHCGEDDDETPEERLESFRIEAKHLYDIAKSQRVGMLIVCPVCHKSHMKTTYHKVFCGVKQRGKSSCKDIYWNAIDDKRLDRALLMKMLK